ncbi:hypothetical protein TNCV_1700131 [Trichonephila clavipes]|nr:hypothetical protein TNCV_1700131 [Trichonephila clavipes]
MMKSSFGSCLRSEWSTKFRINDEALVNIRTLALSTMQVTDNFARIHPNFEEHPGGGQVPHTSLPLPPTSRKKMRLDGYLEYPHTVTALYISNIQPFSGIRNPDLWHRSQRH